MPSTFLSLHVHVVFSTKNREAWLLSAWRDELHAYIGGTLNGVGAQVRQVGGVEDHVHMLFDIRATHCVADIVREVKKASCVWVREKLGRSAFSWQGGYGAFSVSPGNLEAVKRYIENQKEHHQTISFRDELKKFLDQAGVSYEERFLD